MPFARHSVLFKLLLGWALAGPIAARRHPAQGLSNANDFLKALAALWRPVVFIAAAGDLLFFNDQGRELGLSLLGGKVFLATGFPVCRPDLLGCQHLALGTAWNCGSARERCPRRPFFATVAAKPESTRSQR